MRLNIQSRLESPSIACVLTVPIMRVADLSHVCLIENKLAASYFSGKRPTDTPSVTGQWCWAAPDLTRPYPVLKFVGAINGSIEHAVSDTMLNLLIGLILDLHTRHPINVRRKRLEMHIGAAKFDLTEKHREFA